MKKNKYSIIFVLLFFINLFIIPQDLTTNNGIVAGFDEEKDESIKIHLQKIDNINDCLVLYLTGYIDTYNSKNFQKRVLKVVDAGYIKLIFQCEKLNYVSSTGIGTFTAFLKSVKPLGGDIVLMGIQPKVYEVFQLLGFAHFFYIKDSLEEAITLFSQQDDKDPQQIFPLIFGCPICAKKLKATKSGIFRCSECKSILIINDKGKIIPG